MGFDPSVASARPGDSGVASVASTTVSPLPPAGACHAFAQRNRVSNNAVVEIGQEDHSYFGDSPNPDPTNPTPRSPPHLSNQKRWIELFANNSKCNRVWSKAKKVKCFLQVLHLSALKFFLHEEGGSTPHAAGKMHTSYAKIYVATRSGCQKELRQRCIFFPGTSTNFTKNILM